MNEDLTFRLRKDLKTDQYLASLSGIKDDTFQEKTKLIFDLNNLEEVIQELQNQFNH